VISGPSGAGKGTIIGLVLGSLDRLTTSISATTRAPRPDEIDGVQYHFLSRAQFTEAIRNEEFLEWVEYSGNLYGTLRREVEGKLADGFDVILEIELEGARAIRRTCPQAVQVFIAPPSLKELAARLRGRRTEAELAIESRLHIAEREMAAAAEFDHVVVNDSVERAATEVAAIIRERRKGV